MLVTDNCFKCLSSCLVLDPNNSPCKEQHVHFCSQDSFVNNWNSEASTWSWGGKHTRSCDTPDVGMSLQSVCVEGVTRPATTNVFLKRRDSAKKSPTRWVQDWHTTLPLSSHVTLIQPQLHNISGGKCVSAFSEPSTNIGQCTCSNVPSGAVASLPWFAL